MRWLAKSRCLVKSSIFLLLVYILIFTVLYLKAVTLLPHELTLIKGKEYIYHYKMPFTVEVSIDGEGIIQLANESVSGRELGHISLQNPFRIKSDDSCHVDVKMMILGIIPIGSIKVDIVDEKEIMACGNTIGVKMELNGILVIGMSYFQNTAGKNLLPVKDSGIKPGDLILEIDGEDPNNISDFIDLVQKSDGSPLTIKYKSNGRVNSVRVSPEKAFDDNMYHLGLWVRENTAGIGTMTFYDPATNMFGALGHGITDIDTGSLMPVGYGEILESSILAIKKGRQGYPGELKGLFLEDKSKLGILQINTNHGIFGTLYTGAASRLKGKMYPIGVKSDARPGPAIILANIRGSAVSEYGIEILSIARQDSSGSKGMVIKITDEQLLSATGGIVQGMSGCPIIQDGKIIGAVTHVLINDPSRGYGVFIENMLRHLNDIPAESIDESA